VAARAGTKSPRLQLWRGFDIDIPVAALAMIPVIAKEGLDGVRGHSACADCCQVPEP
jgi:hypothetical protein